MRVCLFDDVAGGHHSGYVKHLARAATARNHTVYVAGPEQLVGERWLQTAGTPHRRIIAGRRTVREVIRWCDREAIDMVLNLYLDKTIWSWAPGPRWIGSTAHVLHHTHQYLDRNDGWAGVRTRLARRRLERWLEGGDRVIVHTPHALETMRSFLPEHGVRLLGYPVVMPSSHMHADSVNHRELVFLGYARTEKGLRHVIEALQWLPAGVGLTVVGKQDPRTRSALVSMDHQSRVRWIDRPVADDEYADRLCRAGLAILPYERSFGWKGGASGVLLEALAHGTPVVTTTALAPQLPPEYQGAVVVEPEDPKALAGGISFALEHLPRLLTAAKQQGPSFVASDHSFDAYLEGLLSPP
jgi:glycosyltransferase involved in cell wall biosynthesis